MAKRYTHACGSVWSNSRYCHCAGCHRTFGGLTAFDMHRRSGAGCVNPDDIKELHPRTDTKTGETVWGQTLTTPFPTLG